MDQQWEKVLIKLGVFTPNEALAATGFSRSTFYRSVESGDIKSVESGYYIHKDFEIDYSKLDFIIACKQFGPKSAIFGPSVFAEHSLIEEIPYSVWIMAPTEVSIRTAKKMPYNFLRTSSDLKAGIEQKKGYRICSIERAIVDGFKLTTKIPEALTYNAAKNALSTGLTSIDKLMKMAKILKLEDEVIKRVHYLEN